MRVGLISPYSYTYPGGVGRHVEALAEELGLPVIPGIVPGGITDAHGARFAVAAGLAVEEAQAA